MTTVERTILKRLYSHKQIDIYQLYRDMSFSPGQVAQFVEDYSKKGLIKIDKTIISRRFLGKIKIKKALSSSPSQRPWSEVPECYLRDSVEINKPFQFNLSKNHRHRIISKSEM